MANCAKKVIVRTLWKYGLNAYSLYTSILEDGGKSYRLVTPNRVVFGMSEKDFKSYLQWMRNPQKRAYDLSDKYTLTIKIYNVKTNELIKEYYSD